MCVCMAIGGALGYYVASMQPGEMVHGGAVHLLHIGAETRVDLEER